MNLKKSLYTLAAMAALTASGSDVYGMPSVGGSKGRCKDPLTKRQKKSRKRDKIAKQSRKRNRK